MATVTRRIEVCDVCRDVTKEVSAHARIAPEGGRLRTYAFCDRDYRQVASVLEAIAAADGLEVQSRRGRGSRQVTMEQIEQVKATRKRGRKAAPAA